MSTIKSSAADAAAAALGRPVVVSVVVPCYNDGRYLGEALESILVQTQPPAEIIVVDDGSTDDSAAVAKRYEAVKLLQQANRGIGAARNLGAAAAKGDVLAFLDADDLWPLDSLAVRLERLEREPVVECVFGQMEHFVSPEFTDSGLHCPEGRQAARFAGSMLVTLDAWRRVGGFDETLKVGETLDWVARLQEDGAPVANVDALVMRRRIHDDNTVVRERAAKSDYLRALKAAMDRRSGRTAGARS